MRLIRNLAIIAVLALGALLALRGMSANAGAAAQDAQQGTIVEDETVVSVDDLDVTVNATGSIEPSRQVGAGI